MALADSWERADQWPAAVRSALEKSSAFGPLELILALPEHETPLPGGRRPSQTDLLVLARRPGGGNVAIAVEGKAEESFGDSTVAEWRTDASPGKVKRLAFLLEALGLEESEAVTSVRYQLLHRTAAAVIEARRFGAGQALMLVHSFSATRSWFDDYAQFAAVLGVEAGEGGITDELELGDVRLSLGWVSDSPPDQSELPPLAHRFDRALVYARRLHEKQFRKGTQIPYISHLLAVSALVVENGGDEDEAIAALLHDAVEDQGGSSTEAGIRKLFGARVAEIVLACSDTDEVPKPPWRARKEAYIRHLSDPALPDGALLVSLADKLHNARTILADEREGHDVFSRFNAPKADQAWYYRELAKTFASLTDNPMAGELTRVVGQLFGDEKP